MVALIDFADFIISSILTLIVWVVFAWVIATWLVHFNVINMRNRVIYSIVYFLERVARPILRPIQRVIPPLGGMDLSPLVLLLVIQGTQVYLLPALHDWLVRLVVGGAA